MKESVDVKKGKVFLMSFPFLFAFMMGVGLCMLVGTFFLHRHPLTLAEFLRHMAANILQILVVITALSGLLSWFMRVRVTAEGIHGGTFWSTPVFMTWSEMESVKPVSLFGLPGLRIASFRENCPPLWMPRFFADPANFNEEVRAHTSPAHPLRRSLENGCAAETREDARLRAR